jgi:hypothetical protein
MTKQGDGFPKLSWEIAEMCKDLPGIHNELGGTGWKLDFLTASEIRNAHGMNRAAPPSDNARRRGIIFCYNLRE